jgi:hypothetical protein
MRKSIFTNSGFYWAIVLFLGALLLWNLFSLVAYKQYLALLPIIIQGVLLILIFKGHEHARGGIKIWAIIFLIVSSSLRLIGSLFGSLLDASSGNLDFYLTNVVTVLIGVGIVDYTNKTVKVQMVVDESEAN